MYDIDVEIYIYIIYIIHKYIYTYIYICMYAIDRKKSSHQKGVSRIHGHMNGTSIHLGVSGYPSDMHFMR